MKLSVIVPCLDGEATLEACLLAIRRSDHPDFELIVSDDGSADRSVEIAKRYADSVVEAADSKRAGAGSARLLGSRAARGELLVFVDADILIPPDALRRIETFMSANPGVDALTGRLSREHPNVNFASQYKNLYMNFVFGKLPDQVTFIYGSIFAARPGVIELGHELDHRYAEDTALGQRLRAMGRSVAFDRDLQVIHLKRYSLRSLISNDFRVPHDWAMIFVKNNGWRQLGRHGTGFAHASKLQLVSVTIAPLILALLAAAPLIGGAAPALGLMALWLVSNTEFLAFLIRERGLWFGARAAAFTLLDHLTMASGIAIGMLPGRSGGRISQIS